MVKIGNKIRILNENEQYRTEVEKIQSLLKGFF